MHEDNKEIYSFSFTKDITTGSSSVAARVTAKSTGEPAPHCNVAQPVTPELLAIRSPLSGRSMAEVYADMSWLMHELSPGDPLNPPEYDEET